ncbi:DUF6479 family protein [Streptomyces minutiscleroticus]|uniref:Secreted protein n=1 Tax=Streptomyces minutiscleroticus TaxID=68238 RepID=A0A918U422_9ACTN|nr:DUF6479 family protein [Streptomyces minutiscleroticus]GGX87740.1 hypothetical protein GCM10010358_47230 [Streptomyces minutiscleroticus]
MNTSSPAQTLASAGSNSLLFIVVGVVVVAVLLGAFVWGRRRTAHQPSPSRVSQPRSDSWDTPGDDGTGRNT